MAHINMEKQIKRHVLAQRHMFYAVTAPGLEGMCAAELTRLPLDLQIEATETGGVLFSGRLQALYGANLQLRTAGRILLRLVRFKATNFRRLQKKVAELAWHLYLPSGCVPACKVSAHKSRLYHSQAVADHTLAAIRTCWQASGVAATGEQGQTLYLRIQDDALTLSLDSSGPNLYRRGLKTHAAAAPLRETTAAAVLQMAGYDPSRPLMDPMCGAGTFSLEAALWAKKVPPGALRDFAFMQWPAFRESQWRHLKTKAMAAAVTFEAPMIFASDVDGPACERLCQCVAQHHLGDIVQVQSIDFFSVGPPRPDGKPQTAGLVVLNPPYGRRLASDQDPVPLYRQIGRKLKSDFGGWRIALLAPQPALARQIPFPLKAIPIAHGGLTLTLLLGRVG